MRRGAVWAVGCALLAACAVGGWAQQPKRVKKPTFRASEVERTFFADAFKDALEGARPSDLDRAPAAGPIASTTGGSNTGGSTTGGATSATGPSASGAGSGWAKVIPAEVIEDEIKNIKLLVDKDVQTPTQFAGSGYKNARRHFSMLAMLFAIVSEYDADVRFKNNAPALRDLFARSAANTKVGTQQAFQESKLRKEELQELLGGGSLSLKAPAEQGAQWEQIADRAPLMQRLESGFGETLQPMLSSEADFKKNNEAVLHEASILAAIANMLAQKGMEDADDKDYQGFADRMKAGALNIVDAVKLGNYDQARKGAGEIDQSCQACHGQFQ